MQNEEADVVLSSLFVLIHHSAFIIHHCLMKDFITISETSAQLLRHMLDVSHRLKQQYKLTGRNDPILAGQTLAMIFEKPSLRTRVSFAVAMQQLGGMGLVL